MWQPCPSFHPGPFLPGAGGGAAGRGCQEEGRVGWPSQRRGREAPLPSPLLEPWDVSLASLPLGQPAHTLQVGGLLFKNGSDPVTLLIQSLGSPA